MYIQSFGELFRCRFAVVLDMAVYSVAIETLWVEERGDVWVGCWAVVAFVEVVGCDFPVI